MLRLDFPPDFLLPPELLALALALAELPPALAPAALAEAPPAVVLELLELVVVVVVVVVVLVVLEEELAEPAPAPPAEVYTEDASALVCSVLAEAAALPAEALPSPASVEAALDSAAVNPAPADAAPPAAEAPPSPASVDAALLSALTVSPADASAAEAALSAAAPDRHIMLSESRTAIVIRNHFLYIIPQRTPFVHLNCFVFYSAPAGPAGPAPGFRVNLCHARSPMKPGLQHIILHYIISIYYIFLNMYFYFFNIFPEPLNLLSLSPIIPVFPGK